MIYLLLIILSTFFFISFILEKDIFSPVCLINISYIFAVILLILLKDEWGVEIQANTIFIIALGQLLFVIAYFLYRFIFIRSIKNGKNDNILENSNYIEINKKNYNVMFFISCLILILYVSFFFKSLEGVSFSTFSELMHYYRLNTAYGSDDSLESSIPKIVYQLKKINWAFAYIAMYIFIHNRVLSKYKNDKSKRNDKKYLLPILTYLPLTLLSGGRFDLIVFCISYVVIWIILRNYYMNSKKMSLKNVIKIIILVIAILFIFSSSRTLVGRVNDSNFINYIALYFGAPIANLNEYIERGYQDNYSLFGREIFKGIYNFFESLGLIKLEDLTRTFIVVNGHSLGNVYTAYKYMISASGYFGIIIFQGLTAIFFAYVYTKIKKIEKCDYINCTIILYSVFIYAIILHPFSEFLFSTMISFNYIVFFILIFIIKYFLTKVKM